MKEYPILFSTPMVQAILADRKTMTRRLIKPQPIWDVENSGAIFSGDHKHQFRVDGHPNWQTAFAQACCPYGQVGDRLWVRETWDAPGAFGLDGRKIYKADHEKHPYGGKWKPSIHMPRVACRLVLEITAIRVERLQDISEADAVAEGVEFNPDGGGSVDNGETKSGMYRNYQTGTLTCMAPRRSFITLWQSINGPESWAANPWVWVVTFKRIDL